MGEVGPDFWAISDQIDATIRDTKAKPARLGEGPSLAEAVSALVIDRNRLLAERDRLRAAMQPVDPVAPEIKERFTELSTQRDQLRAAVDRTKELADCFECYDGLLSGQTVATAIRRNLEPYDPGMRRDG